MLPSFRSATLFILATSCGAQSYSAAALASSGQLPLKYTALFGGEASISAIAVDTNGNAYIAGTANSPLPVTAGAFQTEYKPATCTDILPNLPPQIHPCGQAFAAKLTADGTALVYLTFLGASNSYGSRISVDAQGNAWITGMVWSSDLPVTAGAFQTALNGRENAFVLKLNPAGSGVLFATYLGGSGDEYVPTSQAVDPKGNLYIAGYTSLADFPVTPGAFQTDPGPNLNGPGASFVAKFDPNGKLVYSTYFHGGNQTGTIIGSIAADATGNAYMTGTHGGGSLPTTPGAFQTSASGQWAAFVTKLDPTGSKLLYSTYLAGNSDVSGGAIAVDSQGSAYVSGGIMINMPHLPSSFPVTPGAFQTAMPIQAGAQFGFITKLNAAGSALVYSTFLYASDSTGIGALTVDAEGSVVVVGSTYALDFPTTPGALRQCNPIGAWGSTGFLLKLAADGSRPLYATYLGADGFVGLALDGAGEIFIAGKNLGYLPIVPGSFGWTASGDFVASLSTAPLPAGSVSCMRSAASSGGRAIAPGEIVDILGNGIGPAQALSASAASGHIPSSLGGVQVLFNGVPAPLLSAGPNQLRAVVPFETEAGPPTLNWSGAATIQILNGSTTVQPVMAPMAAAAPEIFTVDGRPGGQALMINEDGTLNSEQNPARQDSIVTIYATGLNNTQPPLATGTIAAAAASLAFDLALNAGSAGVWEITYAGAAPGFVAGLIQINFRVPASSYHGPYDVSLTVSPSVRSQAGVYFYIQ